MTETISSNVIVAIRIRPPGVNEGGCDIDRPIIQHIADGCIAFDPPYGLPTSIESDDTARGGPRTMPGQKRSKNMEYKFDKVFSSETSQAEVYEATAKKVVDKVCAGFNATVFAYGATGSGKTFTMVGNEDQPGVMVRAVDDLFAQVKELSLKQGDLTQSAFEISLSYLEVYNETIRDLLQDHSPALQLNEDKNGVMSVKGLTEKHDLKSTSEVFQLLKQGNARRSQCATDQNQQSSRSHAVLQIVVKKLGAAATDTSKGDGMTADLWTSKLSLIDLAGSERAAASTNKGNIQKEGCNINQSLLALGQVINALSTRAKALSNSAGGRLKSHTPAPTARGVVGAIASARPKTASASSSSAASLCHIPYRGSKLTRLLKDSLGGRCMTVMIAAVSPSSLSREDTHNTLKYANRAKQIKVEARTNVSSVKVHMSAYADQIKTLQAQVANLVKENTDLKQQLQQQQSTIRSPTLGPSQPTQSQPQRNVSNLIARFGGNAQTNASSNTIQSAPSEPSPMALTAFENYRSRIHTLFTTKEQYDSEVNTLKCENIHFNIVRSTFDRLHAAYIAGPGQSRLATDHETEEYFQSKIKELDVKVKQKQIEQRLVTSSKLDPTKRQIATLKTEIETDPKLKSDKSLVLQLQSDIDTRLNTRAMKDKDEMISSYSELVSLMGTYAHSSSKALMKLYQYILMNRSNSTTPSSALFTPRTNSAHNLFIDGVKLIVEEGLILDKNVLVASSEEEEKQDTSFIVETIPMPSNSTDEADEEAIPEPSASTMNTYPSYAAAVATPARQATISRVLSAPVIALHSTLPAASPPKPIVPLLPLAAFTSAGGGPPVVTTTLPSLQSSPEPRRQSRRSNRHSGRKSKTVTAYTDSMISMTPIVSHTSMRDNDYEFKVDDETTSPIAPATPPEDGPSTPKQRPLSYAAVIANSATKSARNSATPIIKNKPATKEMFSPSFAGRRSNAQSTESKESMEDQPVPSKKFGLLSSSASSSSSSGITEQFNQWNAQLSQLTVMQAEHTNAKAKQQHATSNSLDLSATIRPGHQRKPSRNEAAAASNSNSTHHSNLLSASHSLPSLSSPGRSTSQLTHALISSPGSSSTSSVAVQPASLSSSNVKTLRARLQSLNPRPTGTTPTNPIVTQLPPVTSNIRPQGSSSTTTNAQSFALQQQQQRKPPIPKQQLPLKSQLSKPLLIPTLLQSHSSSSAVSNESDGENEEPNDYHPPAPVTALNSLLRPGTAPLGSITNSYASQHNQRMSSAAIPIPLNSKPKLMSFNNGSLLGTSGGGNSVGHSLLSSLPKSSTIPHLSPSNKKTNSNTAFLLQQMQQHRPISAQFSPQRR